MAAEETERAKPPRWRRTLNFMVWLAIDQWFLIAMALLIVIASRVQVPADKQELRQTIVTYLGVAIVFFVTGCNLKTRVLIENYSRWKVHLYIQLQCFLMTSAIIFGIVSAAASNPNFMDPALLIGMIFLGCVPTTLSSNVVMTGQAHGNTALTVVQTTIGNFIGPFITPLLIKMYTSTGAWYDDFLIGPESQGGGFGEVYRRVFKQLGFSVYLPMVIGQVVQNLFPKQCNTVFVKYKMKKLGSIALLAIIWQTFDQAFATGAFTSVKQSNLVFIVFINIAFFLVWLLVAFISSVTWLPREDVVTVCYCVPAKTPAMGVPLSNVMYVGLSLLTESKIQIPMILFQCLQIGASSIMTIPLRNWVDKGKENGGSPDKSRTEVDSDENVPVERAENSKDTIENRKGPGKSGELSTAQESV